MPDNFTSLLSDPKNILFLKHENGVQPSEMVSKIFTTQMEHDPSDLNRAREIAEMDDKVPVGILYRNPDVPRYEDVRKPTRSSSWEQRKSMLDSTFEKFSIYADGDTMRGGNGDEA